MLKWFKKISIFQEARMFHLRIWQTPSFLFLLMGLATIGATYTTFLFASKSDDLEVLIISVTAVTLIVFALGVILVRVISKIIIINNARTEFLSLVTHQLRSPLTGTKYIMQLVLSEKVGPLTPEQKEMLQQGQDSNDRMLILVSDLLNISKMADGDVAFDFEKIRIEDMLKKMHTQIEPQAQKKRISFSMHLPKEPLPEVQLDQKKVHFVIQNLIDNAVKYTPEAGSVTVSAELHTKGIAVHVKDTGIGVPKEEMSKLFTKFYRATNAEASKRVGTGLGLYIAKSVIERHHGEMWVESVENQGSTFSFYLPLKQRKDL